MYVWEGTYMGFAAKELELTQYGVNVLKGGTTRVVQGSEIWEEQERTPVVVSQRLEVGENTLEIADSFCYLGDVILRGGGIELAVRERISVAWSKWRELASLLVNHSIP